MAPAILSSWHSYPCIILSSCVCAGHCCDRLLRCHFQVKLQRLHLLSCSSSLSLSFVCSDGSQLPYGRLLCQGIEEVSSGYPVRNCSPQSNHRLSGLGQRTSPGSAFRRAWSSSQRRAGKRRTDPEAEAAC